MPKVKESDTIVTSMILYISMSGPRYYSHYWAWNASYLMWITDSKSQNLKSFSDIEQQLRLYLPLTGDILYNFSHSHSRSKSLYSSYTPSHSYFIGIAHTTSSEECRLQ